jgi:hypothetical protein
LAPLSALLVPIFFVQMGIQVDLRSFADSSVWMLAGAITVVAILGKQVCSLGVREEGLNKTAVGLGMIPRGEVGLIFANEGRKLVTHGKPDRNLHLNLPERDGIELKKGRLSGGRCRAGESWERRRPGGEFPR